MCREYEGVYPVFGQCGGDWGSEFDGERGEVRAALPPERVGLRGSAAEGLSEADSMAEEQRRGITFVVVVVVVVLIMW